MVQDGFNAAPRGIQKSQVVNHGGSDDIHYFTRAVGTGCCGEADGSIIVSIHGGIRQARVNSKDLHHTLCVLFALCAKHAGDCPKVSPVVEVNNALVFHVIFENRVRKNAVFEVSVCIKLGSDFKQRYIHEQNFAGEEVGVQNCGCVVGDPRNLNLAVEVFVEIIVKGLCQIAADGHFGQTFFVLSGDTATGSVEVPQSGVVVLEVTNAVAALVGFVAVIVDRRSTQTVLIKVSVKVNVCKFCNGHHGVHGPLVVQNEVVNIGVEGIATESFNNGIYDSIIELHVNDGKTCNFHSGNVHVTAEEVKLICNGKLVNRVLVECGVAQIYVSHILEVAKQVLSCCLCCRLSSHNGKIVTVTVGVASKQMLDLATVGCDLLNGAVVGGFDLLVSAINCSRDSIHVAVCFVYPEVNALVTVVTVLNLCLEAIGGGACELTNVCLVHIAVHINDFGHIDGIFFTGGDFDIVVIIVVVIIVVVIVVGSIVFVTTGSNKRN